MNCFLYTLALVLFTGESLGKYDPCAITRCRQGEACKLESVLCYTIPCPGPRAVCRSQYKTGFCPKPKPGYYGPCFARCATDADCSGNYKCCGICPRLCTAPVPAPRQLKPGECPNFSGSQLPFCQVECGTDYDCPGSTKCCGTCPRQCTPPVTPKPKPKPGSCPKPSLIPGRCFATCMADGECPGKQKCCGGCPRICKNPVVLIKPGTCPTTSEQFPFFLRCQKTPLCSVDSDCQGARKCCGCPKTGVFPTNIIEV